MDLTKKMYVRLCMFIETDSLKSLIITFFSGIGRALLCPRPIFDKFTFRHHGIWGLPHILRLLSSSYLCLVSQ